VSWSAEATIRVYLGSAIYTVDDIARAVVDRLIRFDSENG